MIHNNSNALSVSAISRQLKQAIEQQFDHVQVRGEISGLKIAASGHAYFTLKDDDAVLNAICWRSKFASLSFKPEEGMDVIATGSITTYNMRSNYQIIIDHLEISGEGALLKLLHERRIKLEKEGLFAEHHKKTLPLYPRHIAIITSPTGAVIKDMLHRIEARFPTTITLWPVTVQGDGASHDISAAIYGINSAIFAKKYGAPDIIIIARGGGSLEDLWPFNDEDMVRAAFASTIPIISAIGHETDHSLLDLVADKRAPTPTAAAEFAVPERQYLQQVTDDKYQRANYAMTNLLRKHQQHYTQITRIMPPITRLLKPKEQLLERHIHTIQHRLQYIMQAKKHHHHHHTPTTSNITNNIGHYNQKLHHYGRLLPNYIHNIYKQHHNKSQQMLKTLEHLSYKNILKRGFAIIHDDAHKLVTKHKHIKPHKDYHITLADGSHTMMHHVGNNINPNKTTATNKKKPDITAQKQQDLWEL